MLADYHIHTVLCRHAYGAAAEYAAEAARKGLSEIGFTDHVPAPDGFDAKYRMPLDEFPAYEKLGADCRDTATLPVLFGVEADYYEQPGCLGFLRDWLPAQRFDLVLGSVHFIRGWGFANQSERARWDSEDIVKVWQACFDLLGEMADTRLFDVVSHLDFPKIFGHRPSDRALREMAQPVLDRIAAVGMGIELNTSGLIRPVKEIYPSPLLLELARERGIPICFGSDAHLPQDVGRAFDQALELAKEAGYTQCLRLRGRQKQLVPLP
jgi:histidinol-phosphatase (PHP family)